MKKSITKDFILCILIISAIGIVCGCKKTDEFLNAKSNLNDVRPTTLNDFQAILDDDYNMNQSLPGIGLVGADNFYLSDANFNSLPDYEQNAYTWAAKIYSSVEQDGDWTNGFQVIEYCNIILDGLNNVQVSPSNQSAYNNVKGGALFFRAYAYYLLSGLYCKPYINSSAGTDLGLPIRTTSDVTKKSVRATVQATYDQMIADAKNAISLLPVKSGYQTRPAQASGNALLAKIYLSMGDYKNAQLYADNSLKIFNTLLDYNSSLVQPSSTYIFPAFPGNPEISFFAQENGYLSIWPFASGGVGFVDPDLYNSYNNNDLRKSLYYIDNGNGQMQFEGNYTGSLYSFCGIATDEVYLIRSECEARLGDTKDALSDINTLLVNRFKTGTFQPISISDQQTLITTILSERRKELAFTGQLRWEDLRRLNQDPLYAKTLTRIVAGITYTLAPGDRRYVYPIPDNEIQLDGLVQNPR